MTAKRTKQARHTRSQIAKTFVAIEQHDISPSDVLHASPACLKRVRVFDVIRRFPRLKGDGASNVLRRANVWPLIRMGQLKDEERDAILEHLPPRTKKIME